MHRRTMMLMLLAVSGGGLPAGCARQGPAAPTAPATPEVTVSKPLLRPVTEYFEFPGHTAAVGEVEIRARVSGYIVKRHFEDGQEVKAGNLLFEIDPRPYQAALDRAQGELSRLKAMRIKAQANLSRAERMRPSGVISQEDFDEAVAQQAMADASLQSAEAAVRDAELNLDFTKVASPISGCVSRARVTEGNLVQPGGGEAMILTTVVTTAPIYVYFNIEEAVLLKYRGRDWRPGSDNVLARIKALKIPVEIGLDNEDGFPHVGVLDFLDNQVDRSTGTIRARGLFQNSQRHLLPGFFVRVRLPFGQPRKMPLVDDRAIGTDLKQKYVLTVNTQNVVEYHQVQLGALQDGLRVVLAGITGEDRVIVRGLQRVRPGLTVCPKTEENRVAAATAARMPSNGPDHTAGKN